MNIILRPIDSIYPYARNARQIPPGAINKVAASLAEFGWRQPIVVDRDGVIICGHVRLLAAQKLGLKEVPVHVAENLTAAQVRAYRLLDNRSHDETTWDEELLSLELLDLKDMGLDLNLTGFDMDEIDEFIARVEGAEGLTDPDAVPEVPENPISKPGDLWIAGNHRILCAGLHAICEFRASSGRTSSGYDFYRSALQRGLSSRPVANEESRTTTWDVNSRNSWPERPGICLK